MLIHDKNKKPTLQKKLSRVSTRSVLGVMGALEREKEYANTNTNPLEHSYTDYADEDRSSWMHQIKKWMKKTT